MKFLQKYNRILSETDMKTQVIDFLKNNKDTELGPRSLIHAWINDKQLDFDTIEKIIYELANERANQLTSEKKERGDTITQEEIEKAFKDFTGKRIPGGEGDDRKIEEFDMEQLMKGVMVEFEHTDDVNYALEIVVDHLAENPKYYDYLENMEKDMDMNKEKDIKANDKENEKADKKREETEEKDLDKTEIKENINPVVPVMILLDKVLDRHNPKCLKTLSEIACVLINIIGEKDDDGYRKNKIQVFMDENFLKLGITFEDFFARLKKILIRTIETV